MALIPSLCSAEPMLILLIEVSASDAVVREAKVVEARSRAVVEATRGERVLNYRVEDASGRAMFEGAVADPRFARGPLPAARTVGTTHDVRFLERGFLVLRIPWRQGMRQVSLESVPTRTEKPLRLAVPLSAELARPGS